ncbi:MAG: hypothetical protein F4Y51_02530 [Cenarchaeum sp. SB0664_bin_35]|nr:hypothetical protein [Cenarchaeum sp. SB0664_bin_35]
MTDMNIHVESVDGSQMAAKITGRFEIGDDSFEFSAIAFGRIGGQNIGAKLTKKTIKEIKSLGYDPDEIIDTLQHNLIQGRLNLPEGLQRESFADS